MRKLSFLPLRILAVTMGINRQYLRDTVELAPLTVTKLWRDEIVSLETILKLCDHFDCDIEDIVSYPKELDKVEDEA